MIMGSRYNFALRRIQRMKSTAGFQHGFLTLLILTNFLTLAGIGGISTYVSSSNNPDSVPSLDYKINVWDFNAEVQNPVTATCRAIGDESYIFLDNALPYNQNYTYIAEMVDTFMVPILVDNFASPPDLDHNGRVLILYTVINGAGGYFSPSGAHSGEVVYINGERGTPRLSTVIHELQHLVSNGYDPYEESWFNEGCSMFSQFLLDYAEGNTDPQTLYYPHDISLLFWDYDHQALDTTYKASLTFIAYLQDQYGSQNLSDIYHAESGGNKLQSAEAIMHIVNQYYPDLSFEELYMDFIKATIIDNKYEGIRRELYFENYISLPSPLRFPAGGVIPQSYPYNHTWSIMPWSTKNYLFRYFPDPEEINITITIPEDSQGHIFGFNLIKENLTLNYTDSSIETFVLTAENVSAGLHLTLNATAEEFNQFYLTISHLDGGNGGYYWDIPSSEKNVEVSLKVEAGEEEKDQSSYTFVSYSDKPKTTSAISYMYVVVFGLGLALLRKRKLS